MKKLYTTVILLCAGAAVMADPPKAIMLDFDSPAPAPLLQVYRTNIKTLSVTLKNNSGRVDGTGYASLFYFYTGTNITPVSTAWTSQTNGILSVSFTPANLTTAGQYTYACGVSNLVSGGITIAQEGRLTISARP